MERPSASVPIEPVGIPSDGLKFAPPFGEMAEKSPLRYASVGTVSLNFKSVDSLNRSMLKKKNVFLSPFVRNGIGPQIVPPKSLRRFRGRSRWPLPSVVNAEPAFRASFTKYS